MFVISINTILYYFYFGINEIKIKTEMFFELLATNDSQYQNIIIPLKDFNKNNTDEVWFQGALYDVASYKISGDNVYIKVLHDNNEERLVNNNTRHFESISQFANCPAGKHFDKKSHTVNDDWKIVSSQIVIYSPTHRSGPYAYHKQTAISFYPQLSTPPPRQEIV